MKVGRVGDACHDYFHHLLIHFDLSIQIQRVDERLNSNGIVANANDEQIAKLLWRYFAFLRRYKLLVIVFLAVHLENRVDVFSRR